MHAALVLGTITILVSGGDASSEKRIRDAFDRAPECLRGAMDDGELRVIPGVLNAEYGTESGSDIDAILASGDETARTGRLEHYIGITDRLLIQAQRLADESFAEVVTCAFPGELEPLSGDLDRVMLHEIAHAFHFDARGGGERADVGEFLDIRWRDQYEAWAEDEERIRIHDEYLAAQKLVAQRLAARKQPTPAQIEHVCALQKELEGKFGRMPMRIPGDFHAFTESNGAEYFAIAIETLAYAPDVFCKTYSAAEIAWLKDVLGECLAQLKKRAACYDAMPAPGGPKKPDGAGIRRD